MSEFDEKIPHLRLYAQAVVGDADLADRMVARCLEQAKGNAGTARGHNTCVQLLALLHSLILLLPAGEVTVEVLKAGKTNGAAGRPPADAGPIDASLNGRAPSLKGSFGALDREQRAVLVLMVIMELSDVEAAVITGMTVEGVWRSLGKALDGLAPFPVGLSIFSKENDE